MCVFRGTGGARHRWAMLRGAGGAWLGTGADVAAAGGGRELAAGVAAPLSPRKVFQGLRLC